MAKSVLNYFRVIGRVNTELRIDVSEISVSIIRNDVISILIKDS
jgi:hypothetical protein